MKNLLQQVGLPGWVVLLVILCSGCALQEEPDIKKDDTKTGKEGAEAFLESLVFTSHTKVTGTVPAVANTATLKTNSKDTLYTIPGIKIPVRISHPVSLAIKGMFITVPGSTFYYEVPADQEEESDTVSVILLEIDAGETGVPYHFPVEITPFDASKLPVDKIERIISVEKPPGNGCDILVQRPSTLGDTTGSWTPEWFWFATLVFNPKDEVTFLNAPGYTFITDTNYEGCCDASRPGGKCHPLSTTLNATVNARIAYSIESETFSFFTNGTFVRQTYERKKNFNPETTNWCAGTAGYTNNDVLVTYFGNHDYVSGKSSIAYGTTYASCDLCGYGSRGGTLTHSCHLLIITRQSDASKEVRIYVRNPVSEWYT